MSCDVTQDKISVQKTVPPTPPTNTFELPPRVLPQATIYVPYHATSIKTKMSKICTRPLNNPQLSKCRNFTILASPIPNQPKFNGTISLAGAPTAFFNTTHQLYMKWNDTTLDDVVLQNNDYFLPHPSLWTPPLQFITSASDVNNIFH